MTKEQQETSGKTELPCPACGKVFSFIFPKNAYSHIVVCPNPKCKAKIRTWKEQTSVFGHYNIPYKLLEDDED